MQRDALARQLYQNIADKIKEFGRMIIAVPSSRKNEAFAYTIGNSATKVFPELLVLRLRGEDSADVLNDLSQMALDREKPFDNGEHVSLGGKHPVLILNANDPRVKTEYTVQVGRFYGNEDYLVQQVVLPDKNGKYPTEAGCHKIYQVPLLTGILH